MAALTFTFLWLAAYIIGSIPTGKILVKLIINQDVQKLGSGNIGTTNVSRVLGVWWAVVVLIIDTTKAFVPVFIARQTFNGNMVLVGLVAIGVLLGNMFSLFLGFKGGKGVATGAGILLNFMPVTILFTAFWIVGVGLISRKMSIGSLSGLVLLVLWSWFSAPRQVAILVLIIACLVAFAHRSNIRRLIRGDELGVGKST
jgi:acyl phosphate:glycerol-3-phosphate acyltransferase